MFVDDSITDSAREIAVGHEMHGAAAERAFG